MAKRQGSGEVKPAAMSAEEKALNNTIHQIEKTFGSGAIMKLGEGSHLEVEGISTGALSLDLALGGKGLPRGRIIELFGPEASGKTTIALQAVANAQRTGGIAGDPGGCRCRRRLPARSARGPAEGQGYGAARPASQADP